MGYGDFYPRTTAGRVVIFLCSLFGVIVVSVAVVSVTNMLEMSRVENKAFTTIRKLHLKKKMKKSAAFIVKQTLMLNLQTKKKKAIDLEHVYQLNNKLAEFKKHHM